MNRCTRCILPATFPGTSFDEDGLCNHCRNYRAEKTNAEVKAAYESKFLDLIDKNRRETGYDLLMAYSGGKDSTYTLDLFITRYGLRVLALTFDNTFISNGAFENMRVVTGELGCDHLIIKPNPKMLKLVFGTAAREELYSKKALERASTICTSCIGLVKAVLLKTAIEKEIPFVGFGWSPGQAPIQSSVMKTNAAMVRITQKAIREPLRRIAGNSLDQLFVSEAQFNLKELFPWNIHPLAFLEYNEEKLIERNRALGWEKPDDTDANSTNCLLNAFANQVHKDRYHFHPYVWEIANMVRSGVMARDKGLKKIESPEDPEMVEYARSSLIP